MDLLTIAKIITNTLHLYHPTFHLHDNIDWPRLVYHADGHSLTPLLYDTWRQAGMLPQIPPDIQTQMAQAYQDNAERNQNIRAELLDIHQILHEAEVPYLLLKGWGLVKQLYADPAHRVLYDHDLLVSKDHAEKGYLALETAGFSPLSAKDEWVEKHLRPLWLNDGYQWDGYLFDPHYPRPVELHVSLWEDGWRGLRVAPLANPWANTRTESIADIPLQLLSLENSVVHLAMHFTGHLIEREARLNQLLDLARFVDKYTAQLDWQQVLAQAEQANISRFVYASLYLATEIFGSSLPPHAIWHTLAKATPSKFKQWLHSHGPTDILIGDYRRGEKGKDYQLTFLAAYSVSERLGIIGFAAFPPLAQLQAIYQVRSRGLAILYYPRFVWERVRLYRAKQ